MLSTFHDDSLIDEESGKPEIISFYNLTKGGVDVVDELKSLYSVARKSNRWPLRIFVSMLDIGGINSHIIYEANTNIIFERREYLKKLALELIKPHIIKRSRILTLPPDLRFMIERISGQESLSVSVVPTQKGCVIYVLEEKIGKPKRTVKM